MLPVLYSCLSFALIKLGFARHGIAVLAFLTHGDSDAGGTGIDQEYTLVTAGGYRAYIYDGTAGIASLLYQSSAWLHSSPTVLSPIMITH